MNRFYIKLLVVLAVVVLIFLFFAYDLHRFLTLEYLKSQREAFTLYYEANRFQALGLYFVIYVATTALSLPGATVLTLAGGALFGFVTALIVVSFASTIGALLAFLVARFLLKDTIQTKFGDKLQAINGGIQKDGVFYLFTLRLIPLFPFFVINLIMGLTPIRVIPFFFVSQLGMLPGTMVYVNAGTQLGQLQSLPGILSPSLILSFALLGIFPLIAKKTIDYIKGRKYLRRYQAPKQFDYNTVVIGAGSGGLVSAYIASAIKANVALIEKHKMGGDCLNTGCVPSKALIRSARLLSYIKRAKEFGFKSATVDFDFGEVMDRVQRVIKQVEPHDSIERYTELGVSCYQGEAFIKSPYEVEVNGKTLTTRSIIVATGGRPSVPPLPGIDQVNYFTSDTIWKIRQRPERLLVLGGGPIGSELAQCFQRLGSQVTIVQRSAQLLPKEDPQAAAFVQEQMKAEGIDLRLGHSAKRFEVANDEKILIADHQGEEVRLPFDEILIALGRKANTTGFGLEALQVALRQDGTIDTDDFLRTNYPNLFAVGDVTGPFQFTHFASHQAWYAIVNALFAPWKQFRADYRVIPWCTYTDPEVARVGLNEQEAKAKGIPYQVTCYDISDLDRAITDEEAKGIVKVLTVPNKDKILGVTLVGHHAGDLITEFVSAMKHHLGLNKILGTIHIYPTLAEANKYAAGIWKKANAPQRALGYLQRYFAWRRKA